MYTKLLKSIGGKIDKTREDVKNMVRQISISFVGEIPGVKTSDIPLNPKKENYPKVQFWKQTTWADLRRGTKTTDSDSPVLSMFLEDELGNLIPPGVQSGVRDYASSFWNGMYEAGNMPKNWSQTSLKTKDNFQITLEGKHPWL